MVNFVTYTWHAAFTCVLGKGEAGPVHTMKVHIRGAEVQLHSFLTSALDVEGGQIHSAAALPSGTH
jgi:hypothetical protein